MVFSDKPEILALIPARGGSKGIPRKNIMQVANKPLIAYSIDHAKYSRLITRVIVTTDDDEIAQVAKKHGAEVPFMRPSEFAQDLSPDIDAFQHALEWLAKHEFYKPDLVVHLRPTGPVRKIELIDEAIDLMISNADADALRSISRPSQTPYKMWSIENKRLKPLLRLEGLSDSCSMPRQMLPEIYWQNGYVDIIRPHTILKKNSMTGDIVLPFIVNDPIFELDYVEDLPEVEVAIQQMVNGKKVNNLPQDNIKRHPK